MACQQIPEPQFDLNKWFQEYFPEPILYLPESPLIGYYSGMNPDTFVGDQKINYENEMKRYENECETAKQQHKNNLRVWKIKHHKYIEMDNEITIKKDRNGKRIAHFEYINPIQDGWRNPNLGDGWGNRGEREVTWEESTTKYISSGDWDKYDFSDNERLLAWRIECNTVKPKQVDNDTVHPNEAHERLRYGDSWTEEEEYDLLKSFSEFLNQRAAIHGRTPNAIKKRIQKTSFM
jgi:gluconate kinase